MRPFALLRESMHSEEQCILSAAKNLFAVTHILLTEDETLRSAQGTTHSEEQCILSAA
jgi:hypothetical protein